MCFIFHSVKGRKANPYTKQNTRPSLQVTLVVGHCIGECVETKHILLFYLDLMKASPKLQHVMRTYCSEFQTILEETGAMSHI
jgi:hypothetical protein